MILLLIIIAAVGGVGFLFFGGGMQALRHRRGGDLDGGDGGGSGRRPVHRLAEPTDEHAMGYGVGGDRGGDPRPARVEHPPAGTERR